MPARSLTPEASFNVTAVNLTAAVLPSGATLYGASAHAALPLHDSADAADSRLLLFVHGHRHRDEWRLQGQALGLPSNPGLASNSSSVLLYNSDLTNSLRFFVHVLKHDYPSSLAGKFVISASVNIGYRCGLLHSLALTQRIWRRYGLVLFTHPDVFLLAPAPQLLRERLHAALRSNASLLACTSKMFFYRKQRQLAYLSDLFAFRPPLLSAQARGRQLHLNRTTGQASCAACLGAWTRMAPRPEPSWTTFWEAASDDCSSSYWEGRGMVKPEQAIHHAQAAYALEVRGDLIKRTTGWSMREPSKEGVWHTHNVSRVRAHLRELLSGSGSI